MKKYIILIAIMIAAGFSNIANAQVRFSVNVNMQPLWGPVGYDHVSYYYMPDIDAYYDVPNQIYVYNEGGRWVRARTLPPRYASYDVYGGYKAVINEPSPWLHNDRYRSQYAGYRGRHDQQMIRDSHEDRYRANPRHPEHNQWHGGGRQYQGGPRGGHDNGGHRDNGGQHDNGGHHDNGGQHDNGGHRDNGGHHDNSGHQDNGGHHDNGNHEGHGR